MTGTTLILFPTVVGSYDEPPQFFQGASVAAGAACNSKRGSLNVVIQFAAAQPQLHVQVVAAQLHVQVVAAQLHVQVVAAQLHFKSLLLSFTFKSLRSASCSSCCVQLLLLQVFLRLFYPT
ncbi:hypothetical protein TNCT_734491 [Trichonephila clavata]|uniref:Uncharacterized protein n=1 Tax=Trichonephila clavata TaxID=2740835 RepID=A0A8X6FSJ7_TRICU|nr:hypothetical protein TNCT_734491 [Trichonephila clavata]